MSLRTEMFLSSLQIRLCCCHITKKKKKAFSTAIHAAPFAKFTSYSFFCLDDGSTSVQFKGKAEVKRSLMLLEVSGNPLFLNSQQVIVQVNDCQISILCMNQEDISVKVRGPPQPHGPVTVTELHINTSLKAPTHFFMTLRAHPLDLDATQSTLLSPDAGGADWCSPSSLAETGKKKTTKKKTKKKKKEQLPGAIATSGLLRMWGCRYSCGYTGLLQSLCFIATL